MDETDPIGPLKSFFTHALKRIHEKYAQNDFRLTGRGVIGRLRRWIKGVTREQALIELLQRRFEKIAILKESLIELRHRKQAKAVIRFIKHTEILRRYE